MDNLTFSKIKEAIEKYTNIAIATPRDPSIDEMGAALSLFLALKPDIYVKGGDYNIDNIDKEEKGALLSVGVEIKFIKFIPGYSTTEILRKIVS